MKQEQFESTYGDLWERFATKLEMLDEKTSSDDGADLPILYRRICKHLALARNRHYTPALVDKLNRLVTQAHQRIYAVKPINANSAVRFLTVDFPRAVRKEARLFWACSLLFYGSALVFFFMVRHNPDAIFGILDPSNVDNLESMYNPENQRSRMAGTDFKMFGFYIFNNIGIGLRTFSGGLFAGFGSLVVVILNGIFFGAITGHIVNMGYEQPFFTFVIAHGSFELTAIVIAGVAGLRLGKALVFPGRLSRKQSLLQAGETSFKLVVGMIFMLFLAAIIEAFWSSRQFAPMVKYATGAALWILVIAYLGLAGRNNEA